MNLLRVICMFVLRMVCVPFLCVFITFSVNLLFVFFLHSRNVFLCDLRMVGVSCLCVSHYLFNESVVRFSAFVLCVLCVCSADDLCIIFV